MEKAKSLSAAQTRVARHLLENPIDSAFLTIGQVATATGVSVASITRLANSLGFNGFSEMRKVLQNDVQRRLAPGDRLEIAASHRLEDSQSLLNHHFDVDLKNLNATMASLDEGVLERVAQEIVSARRVYLMGRGVNQAVVMFLANRLRRCLKQVEEISGNSYEAMTRLAAFSAEDLLIAFDLPRYSRESHVIIEHARRIGAKVILIVDSVDCPASGLADVIITAGASGVAFTNSLVGFMFVCNVISARVLLKSHSRTLPVFRDLEELEQKLNHCISPWD